MQYKVDVQDTDGLGGLGGPAVATGRKRKEEERK
jgi:hypothetical protein